ncbi:hypothetical protein AOXY_G27768 [Acipenser oxyrinchus oxyrinchus]|uniref:Ig-like domain-containing protein n=1 Tax=Acipenser oxyrinchus oxyrinchus TaxID=40147 RepID=A0AAD8FS66_ACIOX|nr:hypothetical protein AOXY_G27768 [Acipenser oxyrinchus oxyrinchus]
MDTAVGPAFLLILFSCNGGIIQALQEREINVGDNVTLQCEIQHAYEISWIQQHDTQAPIVILAINSENEVCYTKNSLKGQWSHMKNPTNNTSNLIIGNVTVEDSALYFCAGRVQGKLIFGNVTKLMFAELDHQTPERNVTRQQCEEMSRFTLPWILVVVSSILLVAITFAFIAYVIRQKGQKGLTRYQKKNSYPSNGGTEVEDETGGLHYVSLDAFRYPIRSQQRDMNTTYAQVNCMNRA